MTRPSKGEAEEQELTRTERGSNHRHGCSQNIVIMLWEAEVVDEEVPCQAIVAWHRGYDAFHHLTVWSPPNQSR